MHLQVPTSTLYFSLFRFGQAPSSSTLMPPYPKPCRAHKVLLPVPRCLAFLACHTRPYATPSLDVGCPCPPPPLLFERQFLNGDPESPQEEGAEGADILRGSPLQRPQPLYTIAKEHMQPMSCGYETAAV